MSNDPGRPVSSRQVDVAVSTPPTSGPPDGAARGGNVLYDPYLSGPPFAGPAAGFARESRYDARRRPDPRQRWLLMLTALGFSSLLTSSAIFAWGVHHWRELLAQSPNEQVAKGEGTREATHPGDDKLKSDGTTDAAPAPAAKVPDTTTSTQIGGIEVVDIGRSSPSLRDALIAQQKLARTKGQTLLLMVTSDCAPCRGVDRSLGDPLMQQALHNVRLVRVNLQVFKEELTALRFQTGTYPWFGLLGPDLSPRDAIHGGEWEDDVASNIAPVLGDFVRGKLKKRRHPEWAPTVGGVQL